MMKRFRTILSLVLVFSFIAAFMTGCADSNDPDASEDASASVAAENGALAADSEFDYATASQFLANDELIMTVNGYEIYWQEYFYWLKSYLSYVQYYYELDGWNSEVESPITGNTITVNACIMELANKYAQYYRVIESYATELGIEITDEDMAGYEESMIEYYGTEEALQEDMDTNYLTKDFAVYMSMINDMYSKAFESLYGSDGSGVSDEEITAYVEEYGFAQAKHILFMTVDDDSNALTDEEIAAKKQQAEEVLAMLNEYSGDDIAAYFQELADKYNEDTGASTYPDGYLYNSGSMVTQFEDAVSALGEYEISGIVESEYGFHIIMRLPVNVDSTPINDSYGYTLKYYAANEAYANMLQEKADSAEIVYADVYETIIPSKVFPILAVEETDSSGTDTTDTSDSSGTDTSAADAT